jgi:hypothetical protein
VAWLVEQFSCLHFDDVKNATRRIEDARILFFAQLDGKSREKRRKHVHASP